MKALKRRREHRVVAVVIVAPMPADSVCDKTSLRDRFRDALCASARGTKEQGKYLKTYGQRAFSHIAEVLWNSLPKDMRSCKTLTTFKTKLKTFLFKRIFN